MRIVTISCLFCLAACIGCQGLTTADRAPSARPQLRPLSAGSPAEPAQRRVAYSPLSAPAPTYTRAAYAPESTSPELDYTGDQIDAHSYDNPLAAAPIGTPDQSPYAAMLNGTTIPAPTYTRADYASSRSYASRTRLSSASRRSTLSTADYTPAEETATTGYVSAPPPVRYTPSPTIPSTSYSSGFLPIPDPPVLVRNEDGKMERYGIPDRIAPVRVPSYYAPNANREPVPYTHTEPSLESSAPQSSRFGLSSRARTTTTTTTQSRPALRAASRRTATRSLDQADSFAAPAAAGGLRLVPALDVPSSNRPNDVAPSQWFEIIRPDNGPLRIGRVSSTCVCVSVRVPKRFIAAGERALVEARIVDKPPYNNLTYGMYVNVLEPVQTMLDTDVTITY